MKLTFEQWKKQVDSAIEKISGLDSDGIPDWDYWMAWQSNYAPKQAAKEAISAAKEF